MTLVEVAFLAIGLVVFGAVMYATRNVEKKPTTVVEPKITKKSKTAKKIRDTNKNRKKKK